MLDIPERPRAIVAVERNGQITKRLDPGSGFVRNEDGSDVTQSQFEEFLGLLHAQGLGLMGLTAGFVPDEKRGDKIVILTNDVQIEQAREEAERQQAADDIVRSLVELYESGDVISSEESK